MLKKYAQISSQEIAMSPEEQKEIDTAFTPEDRNILEQIVQLTTQYSNMDSIDQISVKIQSLPPERKKAFSSNESAIADQISKKISLLESKLSEKALGMFRMHKAKTQQQLSKFIGDIKKQ